MKRVCLHLACVFLLLFSQQVALTHAASHAHGQTPVQHDGSGKSGYQGGLCAQHGAFVQVLGGVGPAAFNYSVQNRVAEHVAQHFCSHDTVAALTPPTRGPPVLP